MKYLGVYTGFRVPARNDKMPCCLNEDGILSGIGYIADIQYFFAVIGLCGYGVVRLLGYEVVRLWGCEVMRANPMERLPSHNLITAQPYNRTTP